MILVIAEKPSVAQTIAAVLGAKEKKDGFLTGSGYIVSWCVGHLVGLAEAAAYGEQYKKWSYDSLPILPQEWKYTVASDKEKQFKTAFNTKSRNASAVALQLQMVLTFPEIFRDLWNLLIYQD